MKKRNWVVLGVLSALGAGVAGGGCNFGGPQAKPGDAGAGVDGNVVPPVGSGDSSSDVNAPDVLDGAKGDEPKPTPDAACAPVDGKRCAAGNRAVETCGSSGAWVAEACPGAFPVCKANLCVEECTPGTKRCQGDGSVQTCQSDSTWSAAVACGAAVPICNPGGVCGTGIKCTAGETRCQGNSFETCSAGGDSWSAAVACPALTPVCSGEGTCGIIECTPGELGCNSTGKRTCQADSRWSAAAACPAATPVCSGEGVCGIVDCVPGNKKCQGNSVLTCPADAKWPASGVACPAATPACAPNGPADATCGIIDCTPGAKECPSAGSARTCQADSTWGATLACGAATPLCLAGTGCVACAAGDVSCRDPRTPQTCNVGAWTPSAACNVGSECKPATSTCGACAAVSPGNAWENLLPAGGPPPGRNNAAMAYDPSDHSMILFGGHPHVSISTTGLNDTWRLAGAQWTRLNPATSPSPRELHAMATNTANGKVYMFGGQAGLGGARNNELWEWNGSTWTQRCKTAPCSANAPTPRNNPGFAYDSDRDRLVVLGGTETGGGGANDMWEWDGSAAAGVGAWTLVCGRAGPACGNAAGTYLYNNMTYAAGWKRMVYLYRDQTYQYSGAPPWALQGTNATPPWVGIEPEGMVYDPVRKVVVAMGHTAPPPSLDIRFWEWNGACWSDTTPGGGVPHGGNMQTLAYDPEHNRVVRFGGETPAGTYNTSVFVRSSL